MSDPTERDAVEAFERLGLTGYQAKTFIALQRLGTGTARDVARLTDVPRSQVYSVAEELAERGLLEVQRSNPIRYRPVSVDEARETLRDRFEREEQRAFEYVEAVQDDPAGEEEREDIWTVRGRQRVDARAAELLSTANERIVFAARLPELLTDEIERVLEERAAADVDVAAISGSAAVRDRLDRIDGVESRPPAAYREDDERSGRFVAVDGDAILLSVVDDDGSETAFWSGRSLFASTLIQLVEASVGPTE